MSETSSLSVSSTTSASSSSTSPSASPTLPVHRIDSKFATNQAKKPLHLNPRKETSTDSDGDIDVPGKQLDPVSLDVPFFFPFCLFCDIRPFSSFFFSDVFF
jgi:hypothetical protein